MGDETDAVVIDDWEFDPSELRFVGGDYGTLTLEGTSEETRRTINALTETARRGSDRIKFGLRIVIEYCEAPGVTKRNASAPGEASDGGTAD